MKSRSFAVACVALTDLAASDQVHRCKDSTGKLMFSDRPCDIGLSRESLYKSLSGERAPSSDTLFKVIHAMGFKLTLEPAHA